MQAKGPNRQACRTAVLRADGQDKGYSGILCGLLQACWHCLRGALPTNKTKKGNRGTRYSNFLDYNISQVYICENIMLYTLDI